jgi:twinkle protein
MISKETVQTAKDKPLADVIKSFGFQLKKQGTELVMNCCFHNESTPSFKVDTTQNFFKCFGCGKSGDSISFVQEYKKVDFNKAVEYIASKFEITSYAKEEPKEYAKPKQQNVTPLSDKLVDWFKTRAIRQKTLLEAGITMSVEYMYEAKDKTSGKSFPSGHRNCVNFNYFRDKELVNVKYRDSIKCFKLSANAELILYNLDSCKGKKKVIITEGEIDTLSWIEAGLLDQYGITSVPNGANNKSNNLVYIDNSIDHIEPDAEIIIATDDDIAGRKLREDLAIRFGKERCKYLVYNGLKDSNELLIASGPQALLKCLEAAKIWPLEGVHTISEYSSDINDMYENGLEKGAGIGIDELDKHITFVPGYITTITGIPSHGKSSVVDMITVSLIVKRNWRIAYYSPENKPTKLHFSKMAKILIGKPWTGPERLSEAELNAAKTYLERKVWFLKPEKNFTLDTILSQVKSLIARNGLEAFVIDAWNRLEHKYQGSSQNETKYIGESLVKLANFCEINKVHCFLVAHPTKMKKEKGAYEVPTLYDISGSSNFYNMTDNGISVYRNFSKNEIEVHVQKIKFDHWGEVGLGKLYYNKRNGRFHPEIGGQQQVDNTNWLISGVQQSKITIPESFEANEGIHISHPEDGEDLPF